MKTNFNQIDSIDKLDELIADSSEKPVVLFKHSNACPISAHAYREMTDFGSQINMVVIQEARDVSDAITEKTGIRHESPQALVLKDGKVVYHAAHYDITAADLESQLAN